MNLSGLQIFKYLPAAKKPNIQIAKNVVVLLVWRLQ